MSAISFFLVSVMPLKASATAALNIVAKGKEWAEKNSTDQATLLAETRLAPDMFPLSFQLQMVADLIQTFVGHVRGVENASVDGAKLTSFAAVEEAIKAAVAQLETLTPEEVDAAREKIITLKLGPVITHKVTVGGLAGGFVLPNMQFHITTAYSILRSKGVELGKGDYIGPFLGPAIAAAAGKN
ncbi:hypothetical protein BROUX41_002540 [Berkeleyomyces rouxiae]|uniref:uncharacterized protein n=1 Tax=Berkeleyomyces rouxiae TaxID=2035830 RepID=UPI003B7CC998